MVNAGGLQWRPTTTVAGKVAGVIGTLVKATGLDAVCGFIDGPGFIHRGSFII